MRTQRQDQIKGWDPESLKRYKVGVIGCGPLAQYTLACLTGLGTENIVLLDNKDRFSSRNNILTAQGHSYTGEEVRNAISCPEKGLHPGINVSYYHAPPLEAILSGCKVIVDLTNDPRSKLEAYRISNRCSGLDTFISASTTHEKGYVRAFDVRKIKRPKLEKVIGYSVRRKGILQRVIDPNPVHDELERLIPEAFVGEHQGYAINCLIAAVVTDEIRKCINPIDSLGECRRRPKKDGTTYVTSKIPPMKNAFCYNLRNQDRFSLEDNLRKKIPAKKKALVVGAGGIGTFVAANLGVIGMSDVTIADFDTISLSNLNRQVFYKEDETGHPKAEVLSHRLNEVFPQTSYHSMRRKIEASISLSCYDIVYSCVDSALSRKALNDACIRDKVPLVNGGITPFRANVDLYSPGRGPCISCQNGYYKEEIAEEKRELAQGGDNRHSCADQGAPNIVIPNAAAAGIMVLESIPLLMAQPGLSGKQLLYSSFAGQDYMRIADTSCLCDRIEDPCRCHIC